MNIRNYRPLTDYFAPDQALGLEVAAGDQVTLRLPLSEVGARRRWYERP
jgi:hypothetical protein